MRATRALVTGGAGFIGSHIVDELISKGIDTTVIDDLSTGSKENISQHFGNKLFHLVLGDARNISTLVPSSESFDVVFHEAAIASVPRSVKEPLVVHDANVNMSLEIMDYCRKKDVAKMVFASSAAVYGVLQESASESIVCKPFSPYGASKLCVENYLAAFNQTYGLKTVGLRYFNVYGPRQVINDYSGVITVFITQLLNRTIPTIHGDGKQIRDFVFVKDIVRANMLAMDSDDADGEAVNVASGKSTSIKKLLEILQEVTHTQNLGNKFGPRREGDVMFGLGSIDKIKRLLGYVPKTSMEDGLHTAVDFFKTKSDYALLRM